MPRCRRRKPEIYFKLKLTGDHSAFMVAPSDGVAWPGMAVPELMVECPNFSMAAAVASDDGSTWQSRGEAEPGVARRNSSV